MAKDKNTGYYLSEVELSGYKSINNVKTSFKNGLNVIIGANASGKTNFLSFLYKTLNYSYNEFFEFTSKLFFAGIEEITIEAKSKPFEDQLEGHLKLEREEVKPSVKVNGKVLNDEKNTLMAVTSLVSHGLPNDYLIIDKPLSFKIYKNVAVDLIDYVLKLETPYFIKKVMARLFFSLDKKSHNSLESIRKEIYDSLNELDAIKQFVLKYSPIEDIRLNDNFNVFFDEEKDIFTINNLFIEFKTEGSWYPFSSLSDGTKRLVYVISEVACKTDLVFTKKSIDFNPVNIKRGILLEEPELGVHPHQLMSLMQFLKEQSREKQIIITTHSPMTLDVLEEDELDRIIVASYNQEKRSTELKHLSEETKAKAKRYMEEDYLSDFWKYSDLES